MAALTDASKRRLADFRKQGGKITAAEWKKLSTSEQQHVIRESRMAGKNAKAKALEYRRRTRRQRSRTWDEVRDLGREFWVEYNDLMGYFHAA